MKEEHVHEKPEAGASKEERGAREEERTWSSLLTLLAPKTLCTLANLCGSAGGK
jgi:hypothetical protein